MADEQLPRHPDMPHPLLSHEIIYHLFIMVGFVAFPLVLNSVEIIDAGREMTLQSSKYPAIGFVLIAVMAAREYRIHRNSTEPRLWPRFFKVAVLGIPLQLCFAVFVLISHVTVTQTTLTILGPITCFTGPTSFEYVNLETIEVTKDLKGHDLLVVTPKVGSTTRFRCDARMQRILPLLGTNAHLKGVRIVGF